MPVAPTSEDRTLHGYFRSSAAYRVRIALALKGLDYRHVGVHLVRGGGEQHGAAFRQLNPQGLVPVLRDGEVRLTQSLAIIEYLDERYPAVPLLPPDIAERARARQIALAIACDIHPLNNTRVTARLATQFQADADARLAWMQHWLTLGFDALETQLSADRDGAVFCVGTQPTIADCCLVPQVFNARRFELDMESYPTLAAIVAACDALPAFQRAHPSVQPDAE